jgi:hypothetical protein
MMNRFVLAALAGSVLVWSSSTPASESQPGASPCFELRSGENYFWVDGRPTFVLGRNPVGMNPNAYDDHFRHAAAAGERFIRIHFTYSPPNEKAGEIDAAMLKSWDVVLDAAENRNLAVLPVLGVWADLSRYYHEAAASAAAFVRDVDFTGFAPVPSVLDARREGCRDRQRADTLGVVPRCPLRTARLADEAAGRTNCDGGCARRCLAGRVHRPAHGHVHRRESTGRSRRASPDRATGVPRVRRNSAEAT